MQMQAMLPHRLLGFGILHTDERVTPSAMAAVRKKMRTERTTLPKRPKPWPALHQNLEISASMHTAIANANKSKPEICIRISKFEADSTHEKQRERREESCHISALSARTGLRCADANHRSSVKRRQNPLFPTEPWGTCVARHGPWPPRFPGCDPVAGPRTRVGILLGIAARIREKY